MKKIFLNIVTFSLLVSLSSCSDSEQNTSELKSVDKIDNNIMSKTDNSEESYVVYNNTKYISIDNNTVSKSFNGEFVNYFTTPDNNVGETSKNVGFNNDFIITNKLTNENIKIFNIRKVRGFYKFDAKTSTGLIVNDLLTNFQPKSGTTQRLNPRVILYIVTAILDSLQPSPLQQCTNAMNSLNCKGNTNPYMNFEDGWFSTSCSVGCR
jgi:hypothetical protein